MKVAIRNPIAAIRQQIRIQYMLFILALWLLLSTVFASGCGLAITHDEYLVICVTGEKRGAVIAYIVPHDYPMPPDMLPKCE